MEPARKEGASALQHDGDITPDNGHTPNAPANDGDVHDQLRPVTFTPTAYTQWIKPAFDRLVALLALTFFALPMVVIALVVIVSMGSPVLFRQRRVGHNEQVFEVLKFRTMGHDRRQAKVRVIHDHRLTHKSDDDPRHTDVGRFLRQFSLDELPQLINILRGEMSIVGPRPELESVVNTQYTEHLHQRHLVKPGLTGLWQISARGSGPMHENGEWDIEYVEKISPLTDFMILCKTPFAMFGRNRGN